MDMELASTDAEILERHDPGTRARCRMELSIVNSILARMGSEGYTATIPEYDGEPTPDLKAALFNLDEAHLVLRKNGQRCGWIYLVFGNSGWDLISDYTTNLERFLKPVLDLSDELERGC